jgi:hypothetical protein
MKILSIKPCGAFQSDEKQKIEKKIHAFYVPKNLHQLDVMLDEELYNKLHDDEQYLEMVDSDEMMTKEYLLNLFDLIMVDLYYHWKKDDRLHSHIDEYFYQKQKHIIEENPNDLTFVEED